MMPSFEGNFLTQRHEICSQETRDSMLSYGKNPQSLSHLGLIRYRVVTDRRTDRITIASTRLALRAVRRKMIHQTSETFSERRTCRVNVHLCLGQNI